MIQPRTALLSLALVVAAMAPARAQHAVFSGAVQVDFQRFDEDVVPSRLNGSASGWTVGAVAPLPWHLMAAVEWSDAGTIADARTTTLDVNGRAADITSTFRHRTKTLAALGGYSHVLSRVRLAYLAGAAFTSVDREFESNASRVVLVTPSDALPASQTSRRDRFWEMTGGVNAFVRVTGRLHAMAGLRAQRISLPLEVSGWSVRTFVGAGLGL